MSKYAHAYTIWCISKRVYLCCNTHGTVYMFVVESSSGILHNPLSENENENGGIFSKCPCFISWKRRGTVPQTPTCFCYRQNKELPDCHSCRSIFVFCSVWQVSTICSDIWCSLLLFVCVSVCICERECVCLLAWKKVLWGSAQQRLAENLFDISLKLLLLPCHTFFFLLIQAAKNSSSKWGGFMNPM